MTTHPLRPGLIIRTAWLTYAGYYLGRVNFSPIIPFLVVSFGITRAEVGVVATALLWTYSLGQYLSGELGNRLSARHLVATGLAISAVCNLLMSLQMSIVAMAIIWGINGFAQSMGWSPILRILADHLEPEQRRRVSVWFPMSYQIGTAVTWSLVGFLVAVFGWQAGFWLPSVLLCGVLALWWGSGIDALYTTQHRPAVPAWRESLAEARAMLPATLASVCIGFVYSGAVIWLPTYFKDTELFPEPLIGASAGLLALSGILGIALAGWLTQQISGITTVAMVMLGATSLFLLSAMLLPVTPQLASLAVAMILLSGATGVTLSAIPILTARAGRTSSAAGTLSAANSIGGGLAGIVVGAIVQSASWDAVFGIWALSILGAIGLIFIYGKSLISARPIGTEASP